MMAICPAGPPKEMKPSLTQKRNASANGTRRVSGTLFSCACGAAAASLLLTIALPFDLSGVPAQQRVQSVEEHAALLKYLAVVFEKFGQPRHGGVEPRGFEPVELTVLEVDVVNDLGDMAQGGVVAEAEPFDEGLEGAVLALVCELGAEHVEGDAALDPFALGDEVEARALVDELPDQPGGG